MAAAITADLGARKEAVALVGADGVRLRGWYVPSRNGAAVIAFPLAWFAMERWLQDFAYRIELQWWMFVLSGAIAVAIALLTVSLQAVKAATADPVKSLRTE